jgi:hypothetical protein
MSLIEHFRLGNAVNSSSSHSVILVRPELGDIDAYQDYGWNKFLCASKDAKRHYLASNLYCSIKGSLGKEVALRVVESMFGVVSPTDVDHQSVTGIPYLQKDPDHLAVEFYNDISQYMIHHPLIAFEGGNDNGDDEIIYGKDANFPVFGDFLGGFSVRRERPFQYTLFSPATGNKIRVNLSSLDSLETPFVPNSPELVDINITDYCAKGCPICYRDCTPSGEHADYEIIDNILKACRNLNVFEVVLGGGEPTSHPSFPKVLNNAKNYGIIPNFTTADMKWLDDNAIVGAVANSGGSFGISVSSVEEVKSWSSKIKELSNLKLKCVYQIIANGIPEQDFLDIVKYCTAHYLRISIVGFKSCGRASTPLYQYTKHFTEDLLDIMQKHSSFSYNSHLFGRNFYFLADVAFLQQYPQFQQELTADVEEGIQSIYIDAVSSTVNVSSYSSNPPVSFLGVRNFFTISSIVENFFVDCSSK